MKTSIENIGGQLCTVVWYWSYGDFPTPEEWKLTRQLVNGERHAIIAYDHIATALPALPRNPKPEDAQLLYRYMAEGIYPDMVDVDSGEPGLFNGMFIIVSDDECGESYSPKITHATHNGERVEIAISGEV